MIGSARQLGARGRSLTLRWRRARMAGVVRRRTSALFGACLARGVRALL
jgi:hypothetical protein